MVLQPDIHRVWSFVGITTNAKSNASDGKFWASCEVGCGLCPLQEVFDDPVVAEDRATLQRSRFAHFVSQIDQFSTSPWMSEVKISRFTLN